MEELLFAERIGHFQHKLQFTTWEPLITHLLHLVRVKSK